ncbi:MAG TPA: helix-turn-helix transcriptional regulator [Pyrinomonadaceae bacterium]|nr:helix-turn-helix transcriptional regulator [Pyrinomonadaceae bacterium]
MGYARPKPKRLAEKLLQIRTALGLSQQDMWRRLWPEESVTYDRISKFETGRNEPPLEILLQYARIAGIHTEALIDDQLDLPDKLPADVRPEEIKRKYAPRGKRKR